MVDPRYIPDDLYYGKIVPYLSNSQFRRFGEDKCYHDLWFAKLRRPATVIKNIAGVYYDPQLNLISEAAAIEQVLNFPAEIIIKPAIDSGEARLIKFVDPRKASEADIARLLGDFGANFIVQEVVRQHPALAELNPSSLNTVRVVSLLWKGEVHILSVILRIGASGARVDNVGFGGCACAVRPDGSLESKAVNRKAQWEDKSPTGIPFAGYRVPSYERILHAVRAAHVQLAHFKIVGWDFAVAADGEPVFVEFNSMPGSNQITCGPTFGALTEAVLRDIFMEKSLANAQN